MALELRAPLAGWCQDLGKVPDPVFADRLMGEGVAIDPTGDCLHAPCDATVLDVHASGHAVTLRAAHGIDLLLHIGLDTVALGGLGFDPLVTSGQAVKAGDPLIRFDLDLLVRSVKAVVTPMVVTSAAEVERLGEDGPCKVGDPLLRVIGVTPEERAGSGGAVSTRTVRVALAHGVHARPAARIAAAVRGVDARVNIVAGEARAAATSSVALLGLAIVCNDEVVLEAEGPEAEQALDRIEALLNEVDTEAAPPPPPAGAATLVAAPPPAGGLRGVGAAPGVAIGPVCRLSVSTALTAPEQGEGIAAEGARLDAALAAVDAALQTRANGVGGDVARAHRELLGDPALREAADRAIARGAHAARAFLDATDEQAATLRAAREARTRERADDLDDLGRQVARAALGQVDEAEAWPAGSILAADELLPSHLLSPAARRLAGIALRRGGATSHVAILAAGLGIPMVVALGNAIDCLSAGGTAIVDGDHGFVTADPDEPTRAAVAAAIESRQRAVDAARALGDRPTETADGIALPVLANLGGLADADAAMTEGAEGSGLLRTEFLFLERAAPPSVDEQADAYRAIVARLDGRPLTLRLLDVGGDKPAAYLNQPAEENPALGERGVRILLARTSILDDQLSAALRASTAGPIRLMIPMIADVAELVAVRQRLVLMAERLGLDPLPLGVMIETPAAALIAGALAEHADFLSIGSNDLAQYTLAMDRGNPAVAAGADALHPAILKLIDATCRGAGPHGCPVGLCGGLAADPLAVPILIGLGIRSLSVPPARVPAVKIAVTALRSDRAERLAIEALDAPDARRVRELARAFVEETR